MSFPGVTRISSRKIPYGRKRSGRASSGKGPCICSFRQDLTQQHGFFHAGITATAMDSAAGYAGFSLMPHNTSVLSVEFKLNLLAPADGELLVAVGEVIKPGKNLIVTRGDAWVFKGAKRTHCAMMQQTLMTMHGKAEKT